MAKNVIFSSFSKSGNTAQTVQNELKPDVTELKVWWFAIRINGSGCLEMQISKKVVKFLQVFSFLFLSLATYYFIRGGARGSPQVPTKFGTKFGQILLNPILGGVFPTPILGGVG